MKIKADTEAQKAIQQLCDIALKMGGLSNMEAVATVLKSVDPIKEKEDKKEPKK